MTAAWSSVSFLAGQPTAEGIAAAQQAGARTVVKLREASELDWDEKATVISQRWRFVVLADGPPDAVLPNRKRRLAGSWAERRIRFSCFPALNVLPVPRSRTDWQSVLLGE
jgi:hypothetical protein